jgi:hypothetical protein
MRRKKMGIDRTIGLTFITANVAPAILTAGAACEQCRKAQQNPAAEIISWPRSRTFVREMLLRILKVIWFFSLLTTSGVLFYVYASLPEVISFAEGAADTAVSREYFFYLVLALLAIFNLMVFVMRRLYPVDESWNLVSWFYGLVIFLNLFLIVSMSFTSLINSGERFDYPRIGIIIYGSLLLLAGWGATWPVSQVVRRLRA